MAALMLYNTGDPKYLDNIKSAVANLENDVEEFPFRPICEMLAFVEEFARVKSNDKWNFINTKGEFLSKVWFEDSFDFSKGHARVKSNGKWYDIDAKGNLTEVIV